MSVSGLIALPPALRTSGASEVLATPPEPAIAVPQIAQSSFPAAVRSPCTGGVAECWPVSDPPAASATGVETSGVAAAIRATTAVAIMPVRNQLAVSRIDGLYGVFGGRGNRPDGLSGSGAET